MSFAEQLKQARLSQNLTQQQVADNMGIDNTTYCGYETGKRQPDVEKLKQLASILKTSGDVLLETGFDKNSNSVEKEEIIIAASSGNVVDADKREAEYTDLKQKVVNAVYGAKLDMRQLRELLKIIHALETTI